MIKRSTRYCLAGSLVCSFLALICFTSYALTNNFQKTKTNDENIRYVSYEILTDNVMPVSKEEEQTSLNVMRPYTAGDIEIGKNYYNYQDDENNQEKSIIYYENTYIQNQGTDYVSKTEFDINAIENGKVLSVTTDDIVGTTVKIEHNNGLISIYQSIKDVIVKENEDVTRGQVIGKSGTNSISSELGNHLHFELYKDNVLINPEEYFNNQGN
jgi:stage II sporulation protein Q